jgi:hypothetical protein
VENMNELLLLKSVLENLFVHKSCITINWNRTLISF